MAIKATVFNSALIQLVLLEQYSDSLELACIPFAFSCAVQSLHVLLILISQQLSVYCRVYKKL